MSADADEKKRSGDTGEQSTTGGMAMPMDTVTAPSNPATVLEQIGPPPSFGKQMAQLVVIPAMIVIAAVVVFVLFGWLVGSQDKIENHLMRLRMSGGSANVAMGIQDPRYKDRWLAAYNVATMIVTVKDQAKRKQISDDLVKILQESVGEDEDNLRMYLLMALGDLGQAGGLEVIVQGLDAKGVLARRGAMMGLGRWPDREATVSAVPKLVERLMDSDAVVSQYAAAMLGTMAKPGQTEVIEGLRKAMANDTSLGRREVVWNAAMSLGRLGDEGGGDYVAKVLLSRETLSQFPATEEGAGSSEKMPSEMQEWVLVNTIAACEGMNQGNVWQRIKELADNDPSVGVRARAKDATKRREASLRK